MTITLVSGQTASAALGSVASGNVVLPNNPAEGNFVVIGIGKSSATSVPTSVVDSNGNVYVKTPLSPANGNGWNASIWYWPRTTSSASKTITVTTSGSEDLTVWAGEFSGVLPVSPLDVEAVKTSATAGTNINLPTVTPGQDNELLIGVAFAGQSISTANSPWALMGAVANGNAAEYAIQTTAGAQAMDFTQSPSGTWTSIVAAFKPYITPGTYTPPSWSRRGWRFG